ncbi:MAG: hypothetical protein AAF716_14960 [Cyanobacteria bacterium P01_D01_bin.1]
MDTADIQPAYQESAATETRRSLPTHYNAFSASTGSNLLDSFIGRMTDGSVTTLLGDRPVVDESWLADREQTKRSSTAGEAPQKQVSPQQKSSPKTSRELAIERMGRVLESDRAELR